MILSRLSRAVREQNWFAVVLEFVIVVAGVLLAFQISQFAQARSERGYALDTLARAEIEIEAAMRVRGLVRESLNRSLDELAAARPIIMGGVETNALTPAQCAAVADSGGIGTPPDSVPAIDEFMRSGALASITDADMRLAAMNFASYQNSVRTWWRQNLGALDNLPEAFPDAVWFELVEAPDESDGWTRRAVCDLEAMRGSPAFQTHLMGNYSFLRTAMFFAHDLMDDAFVELQAAIATELHGADHASDLANTLAPETASDD